MHQLCNFTRRAQEFLLGTRAKGRRLEREEGAATPPHPLGGLGKHCELLQWGSGRSPIAQKFSTIFNTQDGLSWHYNIINCELSCSHWGTKTPVPAPFAYALTKTTRMTHRAHTSAKAADVAKLLLLNTRRVTLIHRCGVLCVFMSRSHLTVALAVS